MTAASYPAGEDHGASTAHLRRLRWAVRLTLTLGVAASVAANILHARPNPISQLIAAWPPLALLLTVELISRVPVHQRWLGTARLIATAAIASIAAWISYHHMMAVAARYGETGAAPYLLPVSVDGLIVVASISLVELTARIRATGSPPEQSPAVMPPASATPPLPVEAILAAQIPDVSPPAATAPDDPQATAPPDETPSAAGSSHRKVGQDGDQAAEGHQEKRQVATKEPRVAHATIPDPCRLRPDVRFTLLPDSPHGDAPDAPDVVDAANEPAALAEDPSSQEPVPVRTAAAVAYWYRRDPNLHPAEIGERIGRSERTVRRHWPPKGRLPQQPKRPLQRTHRAR